MLDNQLAQVIFTCRPEDYLSETERAGGAALKDSPGVRALDATQLIAEWTP